ncbi:MAG TPA: ATP-binding cassette domain-containing protein [Candidatus Sulfomarinibacteraceae bacterium]|nr:ATP-binding cassette domain-containing protein [Candidatus Sulfomarinibacteraceae bacterium]
MNELSEPILSIKNVSKTYATVRAVDDLSFDLIPGEIFGLLGPNGAGKTTTIRMILDIIKPDNGHIAVLGGPMTEDKKERIGYLPEERGLYEDMTLMEVLLFMGQLKGLSRAEARRRVEADLKEVDLWEAHERKVEALSRGMRQKAQFVAATMHDPDLIIIDEPFSGLDPVNTRLIKNLIYHMRDRGAGIIMSTHQMHQVEEMCSRILLINHGRRVLYGPLDDIRHRFSSNVVDVSLRGTPQVIPGVQQITAHENGNYRLLLDENAPPEDVLQALVHDPELVVERFERVQISLDEIFIRVVGRSVEEEGETAQPEGAPIP